MCGCAAELLVMQRHSEAAQSGLLLTADVALPCNVEGCLFHTLPAPIFSSTTDSNKRCHQLCYMHALMNATCTTPKHMPNTHARI